MLPIRVHLTPSGPYGWKVVVVLQELALPYEINAITFGDVKRQPFLSLNPNGRNPVIEDPNNAGFVLWESGAIIQYLVDRYDTAMKLTHGPDNDTEKYLEQQWLMFQMSGQGPYFGQASWFRLVHPEKVPSAMDRYDNETRRVLKVLDGALQDAGKQWLVGNKMTYADLSFAPYNDRVDAVLGCERSVMFGDCANVQAWHERMTSRDAWKTVMKKRADIMDSQGYQPNGLPKGYGNLQEFIEKTESAVEAEKAAKVNK